MDKKHLSFTQINMFLRCARQYEFRYIKGLRRPPSGALILGKSWHKAVELNYSQKIQTEKDLPIEDVQDCFSDAFEEAFDNYIADGKPLYVSRFSLEFPQWIEQVSELGGFIVWAHPFEGYNDNFEEFIEFANYVTKFPIAGIERIYNYGK